MNLGGGGGAASAPANGPWYGPWKPGTGGRAPNGPMGAGGPCIDMENVVLACLCGKETLGCCTVSLALTLLFECVLDDDALVHHELVAHGFNGRV